MALRGRRAVLALALAVAACGSDDTSSAIDAAVTDGALIVDGPPVDAGPATWDQCGVAGGCQSSLLTTSLEYDATATSLVTSQPYVNGGTVVATYTRQ